MTHRTRRARRASSAPQQVGSDEGLTSSRATPPANDHTGATHAATDAKDDAAANDHTGATDAAANDAAGGRHTPGPRPEQTRDDTDEGWGDRRDDDASARWLRENRPPHWD